MLPHYSPLKVAESFSLLAGLFPGRIDLGLGRAVGHRPDDDLRAAARPPPGRCPTTSPSSSPSCSPTSRTRCPADHPFARLARSLPGRPEAPEPWLLGSSPQSAIWAAELGLPYAFADFINPDGAAIATDYQRRFDPGVRLAAPRIAVGDVGARRRHRGGGLAADRVEPHGDGDAAPRPADRRPAGREGAALPRDRGRAGRRRAPPDHRGHAASRSAPGWRRSPQQYGADEVIVVTITYDHEARRRSYELLADAFGLGLREAAELLVAGRRRWGRSAAVAGSVGWGACGWVGCVGGVGWRGLRGWVGWVGWVGCVRRGRRGWAWRAEAAAGATGSARCAARSTAGGTGPASATAPCGGERSRAAAPRRGRARTGGERARARRRPRRALRAAASHRFPERGGSSQAVCCGLPRRGRCSA